LRAFTTASWVIDGGASALFLASSATEALATKTRLGPRAVAITDGELTPGFDLGNSPAQVRRSNLVGCPVVQTTTNGTIGVHAAAHAPLVLAASLVTATATARILRASGADRITYVITGARGTADEDAACADLIHELVIDRRIPTDTVARVENSAAAASLREAMTAGFLGVDEQDVRLACEIDRFDFAMSALSGNGQIQLRPVSELER
jgi:2-phosphosulfolactate phosphatase